MSSTPAAAATSSQEKMVYWNHTSPDHADFTQTVKNALPKETFEYLTRQHEKLDTTPLYFAEHVYSNNQTPQFATLPGTAVQVQERVDGQEATKTSRVSLRIHQIELRSYLPLKVFFDTLGNDEELKGVVPAEWKKYAPTQMINGVQSIVTLIMHDFGGGSELSYYAGSGLAENTQRGLEIALDVQAQRKISALADQENQGMDTVLKKVDRALWRAMHNSANRALYFSDKYNNNPIFADSDTPVEVGAVTKAVHKALDTVYDKTHSS